MSHRRPGAFVLIDRGGMIAGTASGGSAGRAGGLAAETIEAQRGAATRREQGAAGIEAPTGT